MSVGVTVMRRVQPRTEEVSEIEQFPERLKVGEIVCNVHDVELPRVSGGPSTVLLSSSGSMYV
jgi:hypothetical protein